MMALGQEKIAHDVLVAGRKRRMLFTAIAWGLAGF